MFKRLRHRKHHLGHQHHHEGQHCDALCCAHAGQQARVLGFSGTETEAARLRDLGVHEGVLVTVLRDGDPLMVRVDDARIGIGRSAAMNVLCHLQHGKAHHSHACDRPGETTMASMQPGQRGVVRILRGDADCVERLMEMGLIAGTPFTLLRFAPMGDPLEIVMRGYHLSVRKSEAAGIVVDI